MSRGREVKATASVDVFDPEPFFPFLAGPAAVGYNGAYAFPGFTDSPVLTKPPYDKTRTP